MMIKDRHTKESSRTQATKPAADRSTSLSCSPTTSRTNVAESPKQDWKKYTDSRMRQFSCGR